MGAMVEAQIKFTAMLGELLVFTAAQKLPVKATCVKCEADHHMKHSLHKDGLAADLPMVWPDGRYGTWEEYEPMGIYWESIGGYWGGRRNAGPDGKGDDANHFSLAYGGRG